MRFIADFHIHSRFARACSKALSLPRIAAWAQIKGIDVISVADFTHPAWFSEIEEQLEESDHEGLYRLSQAAHTESELYRKMLVQRPERDVFFIFTTEVSCIYSDRGKVRRIHLLVFAPSREAARAFAAALKKRGANISSDGRPILGMSARDILSIALEVDERCFVVPAHAWTPWFAIFGSKSGFDSIEECFGDLSSHITAIETGLSSDPPMNWQLSRLNDIALISSSDAHSLEKLGREATVFEGDTLSYNSLVHALQPLRAVNYETPSSDVLGGQIRSNCARKDLTPQDALEGFRNSRLREAPLDSARDLRLASTIEFYPEEGMYHVDGHRECAFSCEPERTKKINSTCPVCSRPLTVGVLNRVSQLADQSGEMRGRGHRSYVSIVPLQEIIAEYFGVE